MGKKRTSKVETAIAAASKVKPVRLDLTVKDYARLEKFAEKTGLSKASVARMALLRMLEAEEASR